MSTKPAPRAPTKKPIPSSAPSKAPAKKPIPSSASSRAPAKKPIPAAPKPTGAPKARPPPTGAAKKAAPAARPPTQAPKPKQAAQEPKSGNWINRTVQGGVASVGNYAASYVDMAGNAVNGVGAAIGNS